MEIDLHNIEPFYEDDRVKVLCQDIEGITFMHCYVYRYTPSVLKHLKALIQEIKDIALCKGFKSLACITPSPKFAKALGGESILKQDGMEVFRWDLKH